MNQNNKFIGYLQHGTKQQPQPHRQQQPPAARRCTSPPIRRSLQDSPSWVYKGEWNGTITQNMFAEVPRRPVRLQLRPRQQHRSDALRRRSSPTRSRGGGRDWLNKRRRNQYTGALSYFKDNFAGGSHNFKFGGEYLDEIGQHPLEPGLRRQRDPLPEQRRAERRVAPVQSAARARRTRWRTTSSFVTDTWTINRLTLNVGARFDRYRVWLPEQDDRRVSRFNPVARTLRRDQPRS